AVKAANRPAMTLRRRYLIGVTSPLPQVARASLRGESRSTGTIQPRPLWSRLPFALEPPHDVPDALDADPSASASWSKATPARPASRRLPSRRKPQSDASDGAPRRPRWRSEHSGTGEFHAVALSRPQAREAPHQHTSITNRHHLTVGATPAAFTF